MTLLNLAILQINTGASQITIDKTLQRFHQSYSERAAVTSHHEVDTTMLEIATKLKTSSPMTLKNNEEEVVTSPSTLLVKESNDKNFMIKS